MSADRLRKLPEQRTTNPVALSNKLSHERQQLDAIPAYQLEKREQLKEVTSLGTVLRDAENYSLQHFAEYGSPEVLANPKLESVLTVGNYQGVEQTSEEYGQLLRAKSARQKMAREIVADIITDPEAKVELSPEQRILLKYGLQIQNTVDDLHILWHDELVRGPNASQLKNLMENNNFLTTLIGEHGDFIYGLLRKEDNSITYYPYAKAYPHEIGKIAALIDGMTEELAPLAQKGSKEAAAHIAVHQQWEKLLTFDGDAKQQEILGKELDVVWMRDADATDPSIHSQVLYPMEAYAAEKSVEWQYDILLKQPEYDRINAECDDTKWKMHKMFQTDPDFAKLPTLQESLAILIPTDSTVYLRFIGGTPLGFRSAASNVPNRNDVRLGHDRENPDIANGSKINFDYTTFEQRSQIAQGLVKNAFGEEKASEIFGNTTDFIPILLGRFIAGHEDAHNILERPDTYKTMGMQNHIDLDETKADLASMVTCFMPGFLKHSQQADLLKVLFAEELRGLSRWGERQTDRAHLNGNIVMIQLMMDNGIVEKTKSGWEFHATDPEKIQSMQSQAKQVLLDLAQVYEARDPQLAQDEATTFKTNYLDIPSRGILELIHDAKIISDKEYAEEMQEFYPSTRRGIEN